MNTGGRARGTTEDRRSFAQIVRDAAIEAEYRTGRREANDAEARRGVILRLVRIIGGFALIVAGIAALPLPGPGWLIILVGLELLPFVWAERTIRLIRRKIPGVPEDGRIPARTWVVMGTCVVAFTVLSFRYGPDLQAWATSWGDPERLLG